MPHLSRLLHTHVGFHFHRDQSNHNMFNDVNVGEAINYTIARLTHLQAFVSSNSGDYKGIAEYFAIVAVHVLVIFIASSSEALHLHHDIIKNKYLSSSNVVVSFPLYFRRCSLSNL